EECSMGCGEREQYATVRWDPVKQAKVQEWAVDGSRATPPRRYAPFVVAIGLNHVGPDEIGGSGTPATLRFYSPADGMLVQQISTDFVSVEPERLHGHFLLSLGHERRRTQRRNTVRFHARPPFVYELWEIPSRDKVRVFSLERQATIVLGPGGKYLIRVLDAHSFEVYEPFVLKTAVAKVATPFRAETFEFSPD